jgi:hypothetical protein
VVAERLALAGLRVAYSNLSLPLAGPFISSMVRRPGALHITYDQDLSYNGGGGFSLCLIRASECDATISLRLAAPPPHLCRHWAALPPGAVSQTGPRTLEIRLGARLHRRPFVLAYLWAETPVR